MRAHNFYEQVADNYNLPIHETFYGQIANQLLAQIPDDLQVNKILEIGAGTGFSTYRIKKRFQEAKIIALEPSSSMLSKAQDKLADVHWHSQTLTDFSLDKNYDLVFSSMAAHWLTSYEWEKLLALNKKSTLALALPSIDNKELVDEEVNALLRKLIFKNRGEYMWPRQRRHQPLILSQIKPFSRKIYTRDILIKEKYSSVDKLVESLHCRGVFLALFGNNSRFAKDSFLADLKKSKATTRLPIIFNWAFKLLVSYPKEH